MLWIWKFEPCFLKQWWPSLSLTDLADVLHPTPPLFFPEISVHWKHCAFAIFLSSASAGIETCHSHTSHSNRELKQQCYIKLHLMEMHPGALCRGCSVSAMGNLREAFCWKKCLCSEPVTHNTRMHAQPPIMPFIITMHNNAWVW